mmetsp:Transcript_2971/g.7379  ORF Transcript_2971/g.7379 Transcript_2971/m.7379 type:complete len:408 (+) Transcript_2971:17-1240(+)
MAGVQQRAARLRGSRLGAHRAVTQPAPGHLLAHCAAVAHGPAASALLKLARVGFQEAAAVAGPQPALRLRAGPRRRQAPLLRLVRTRHLVAGALPERADIGGMRQARRVLLQALLGAVGRRALPAGRAERRLGGAHGRAVVVGALGGAPVGRVQRGGAEHAELRGQAPPAGQPACVQGERRVEAALRGKVEARQDGGPVAMAVEVQEVQHRGGSQRGDRPRGLLAVARLVQRQEQAHCLRHHALQVPLEAVERQAEAAGAAGVPHRAQQRGGDLHHAVHLSSRQPPVLGQVGQAAQRDRAAAALDGQRHFPHADQHHVLRLQADALLREALLVAQKVGPHEAAVVAEHVQQRLHAVRVGHDELAEGAGPAAVLAPQVLVVAVLIGLASQKRGPVLHQLPRNRRHLHV